MTLSSFVGQVLEALARAGIPHMVTGSLAASYYGEPRSTQDLDLVVELLEPQVQPLCEAFLAEGFYVSPEAAHDAVRDAGQFNVIDSESGWKADLIARKRRPFSEAEFARRSPVRLLGHDTFVVSAEDLVIAKLEWARLGESERQLRDVLGILQVQGEALDSAHIERWVGDLALEDLWAQVQGLLP